MQTRNEFPCHLLKYMVNITNDSATASTLLADEYIFATYFAALIQPLTIGSNYDGFEKIQSVVKRQFPNFKIDETELMDIDISQQERMMKIIDNLRSQFTERITASYVRDFFLCISIYRHISELKMSMYDETIPMVKKLAEDIFSEVEQVGVTSITHNLNRLQKLLKLKPAERKLIELNCLMSIDVRSSIFRDFVFNIVKNISMFDYVYKQMITFDDVKAADANQAFSESSIPLSMGIVNYNSKTKKLSPLSDFWVYTITAYSESDELFFQKFVKLIKEKKRSYSGAIAKIQSDTDSVMVKEFFTKAVDKQIDRFEYSKNKSRGVADSAYSQIIDEMQSKIDKESSGYNALFYGGKNLDKLGFIYTLLKSVYLVGWQVVTKDARSSDVPGICAIAQKYLASLQDSSNVLVIDKTEEALSKQHNRPSWLMDLMGDDHVDKPEDEELSSDEVLLIKNPIPTIWIASSVTSLTPENVGRFSLHIELKGGSRKDRRAEVEKVCAELNFSDQIAQKLSLYHELNVEQIKSASRTTSFLGKVGNEGERILEHLIKNSQKALMRDKMEKLRPSVTKYDLGLLNIAGSLTPERIIQAFKKNPVGTLCLHGLPGTGKTALAEYIAMVLDMPLIIKPASELMSMWLGENEKNIAKMFEEGLSEGAIILLDEADSFLRDRAMAQRSWEVTQVNELLQQMERYPGIFICATNLFQSIDAAALRRFTFKLQFLAMTDEQRVKMLENEANFKMSDLPEAERDHIWAEVNMIRYLAPGDFATVKRQTDLLEETLDAYGWIERLKIESQAKLDGVERNAYSVEPQVAARKKGE